MKRIVYLGLLLVLGCGAPPAPRAEALPAPKRPPGAASQPPDPEPWRNQRPAAGVPGKLQFPTPEQATLASGLTVAVVRKPVPVASISLVFRHGASAAPVGKSGLAALTARMLTEGTRKHPGVKLAEAVEQLGSTLDEDVGRDTSTLSVSALSADIDRAIELLGEVVSEPGFVATDFERVQKEWLDGLRSERQAPERLASMAALASMLGKPHGSPVGGSLVDVQKLTLKDLIDFHRKAYGAADATLIVVGDVDLATVRGSAEKAFKKLGRGGGGSGQPFTAPPAPPARRILLVDRPGAVQSALFLAQQSPKRSEPGFESRELLTRLFGGLFTSRLNMNLREEHAYTYGAHAQSIATRNWGAFYIATSVRTDVTAAALQEALKELRRLKDPKLGKPIEPQEIARARADLVQSLGARLEYGGRIASSLAELWLHGLPSDYYARYPNVLAAETPETLTRTASTLDTESLVIVVVGDRNAIEAPLKQLGYQVEPAPPELTE
jgi:zinc protease